MHGLFVPVKSNPQKGDTNNKVRENVQQERQLSRLIQVIYVDGSLQGNLSPRHTPTKSHLQ